MRTRKQKHPLAPTSRKEWLSTVAIVLGAVALAYLIVADIVFKFRHPWATDWEVTLHTWDAITFTQVPYNVMRSR